MSLADDLKSSEQVYAAPHMPIVDALLEELSPEEAAVVKDALNGSMASERLSFVLAAHGHKISASTIRLYRRMRRQVGDSQND